MIVSRTTAFTGEVPALFAELAAAEAGAPPGSDAHREHAAAGVVKDRLASSACVSRGRWCQLASALGREVRPQRQQHRKERQAFVF